MRNAMIWCLAVCAACAACGSKKDDQGAGSGASPGTTAAGSAAGAGATAGSAAAGSATGAGAAAGSAGGGAGAGSGSMGRFSPEMVGATGGPALPSERKTRIFECAFAKVEGEGKERKVSFKLKNLGDRKAASAQSWIYYYDKADKLLSRYPHRFFTELDAGATEEQALGQTGAGIPKDAAVFDCEISEVAWSDKTTWSNDNLSSYAIERPRGGWTHEQLLEREGERVTATWTGKVAERPVLALKNISGRPLTARVVWVYQYDQAGKQLDRAVSNVSIALEPGAEIEDKIGPKGLKAGAKYVEAVVSEVQFRDGKNERWLNDNLAPLVTRPMKGPLAPAKP